MVGNRYTLLSTVRLGPQLSARPLALGLLVATTSIIIIFVLISPSAMDNWFVTKKWIPDVPSVWDYIRTKEQAGRIPLRRPSWGALKSLGPKASFKTNLRDDKKYLITFALGGWNNEVISIFNLIYLAYLARRIPIIPEFTSHAFHIGYTSRDVAVSEVFGLDLLSSVLDDMPIVEIHELKMTDMSPDRLKHLVYDGEMPISVDQISSDDGGVQTVQMQVGDYLPVEAPVPEELGCWSFWQSQGKVDYSTTSAAVHREFTPLPPHLFFGSNTGNTQWRRPSILKFAEMLKGRHDPLPAESKELLTNHSLTFPVIPPEDHVSCIDSSYYFTEQPSRYDIHDEWISGEGVWNRVGKHLRFQPGIISIRDTFLRTMFALRPSAEIPPYVAIHIRRTDFAEAWKKVTPRQFAHATEDLLITIRAHLGIEIDRVIVATDEVDEDWLRPLKEDYGFHYINHTEAQTVEKYGHWLPTFLDSALMSGARGFLGNPSSTMSILCYRRVIDWEFGVGRLISLTHTVPEDWEWTWATQ